jgi:hypothetical protein
MQSSGCNIGCRPARDQLKGLVVHGSTPYGGNENARKAFQ